MLSTQGFAAEDFQHPERVLALAVTHPVAVMLLKVLDGFYLAQALLSLVVMVALVQRVQTVPLGLKLLTFGPTWITAALYLAAAATDLAGLPMFVQLAAQHDDQPIAGYRVLVTLTFQWENAADATYGVSILVISWAGRDGPYLGFAVYWAYSGG